jgi:hypothetical protein
LPVDQTKDVDQREWPLVAADGEDVTLRVTHTTTTKDIGQPSQVIEHRWEAEIQRGRTRLVVVASTDQADFDNALNTWRQAIVDARALLPDMA